MASVPNPPAQGTYYLRSQNGRLTWVASLVGATGPAGKSVVGPQGVAGPTGAHGPTGPTGPTASNLYG